ncbi:MAG: hypothetical protein U5K51_12135 [Flavobacteriaceae bacterium]|nr:hypothetical protein [Flavobacteriaceae bacterium]
MRYFIELSYNGTAYHGWQKQPNARSVQEVIENALRDLLSEEIVLMGCGRTDTGVHAEQYFAHFDCTCVLKEGICYTDSMPICLRILLFMAFLRCKTWPTRDSMPFPEHTNTGFR